MLTRNEIISALYAIESTLDSVPVEGELEDSLIRLHVKLQGMLIELQEEVEGK